MPTADSPRRQLPPYLTLKIFAGFIEKLKETTVPDRIDGSVLKTYSGSTAATISGALKFFGLIEEGGTTTKELVELSNAYNTATWPETLKPIVVKAYAPIVKDLKLENATPQMLAEKFRDSGAEGEVLEKCVRFFESIMTEVGVKLSPHILNKSRSKPDRSRPRQKRKETMEEEANGEGSRRGTAPIGTVCFPFPIPGKADAALYLPPDVTNEDWELIDEMMRLYLKKRQKQ